MIWIPLSCVKLRCELDRVHVGVFDPGIVFRAIAGLVHLTYPRDIEQPVEEARRFRPLDECIPSGSIGHLLIDTAERRKVSIVEFASKPTHVGQEGFDWQAAALGGPLVKIGNHRIGWQRATAWSVEQIAVGFLVQNRRVQNKTRQDVGALTSRIVHIGTGTAFSSLAIIGARMPP